MSAFVKEDVQAVSRDYREGEYGFGFEIAIPYRLPPMVVRARFRIRRCITAFHYGPTARTVERGDASQLFFGRFLWHCVNLSTCPGRVKIRRIIVRVLNDSFDFGIFG